MGKIKPPMLLEKETPVHKESPYFATFLQLHSYLFVMPYRTVRCSNSGEYILITSLGRKVFSGIFSTYVFIFLLVTTSSMLWNFVKVRHGLSYTFSAVSQLAVAIAAVLQQKILWTRREDILKLTVMTSTASISNKNAKLLAASVYLGVHIASLLHGWLSTSSATEASIAYNFLKMVFGPICHFFSIHPITSLTNYVSKPVLIRIGVSIFSSFWFVIYNSIVTTIMILVLTMRHAVTNNFSAAMLEAHECRNFSKVLKHYNEMKDLSRLLRELFGDCILCYYIGALSFFAEVPQILLSDSEEYSSRVLMVFYFIVIFTTFGIASSSNTEIEQNLRNFISCGHWDLNRTTTERLQLLALTHELSGEPIGISCSYFTFTRHFLSSTCSLAVTYCLIIFQVTGHEPGFWESD